MPTSKEVAMIASIDIAIHGRPSANQSCDIAKRKEPHDDTKGSSYDSDGLRVHGQ